MKTPKTALFLAVPLLCGIAACTSGTQEPKPPANSTANAITINPKAMKHIGSVSDRYQSYNVEMVEVVGGKFWRPYKLMDSLPSMGGNYDISADNEGLYRKLPPVNLADKRLLNLAKGLAPAYVRVSGTWANATYFQNDGAPAKPAPAGFVNVLTRDQWKGVVDFVKATNSELVTSFAVSNGVRDKAGVWTPKEAQKIVDYTTSLGGSIAAAELFNEPNMPAAGGAMNANYDATNFAKDQAAFRTWARKAVPHMLTVGPGSVDTETLGMNLDSIGMKFLSTDQLMSAEPRPTFDVFSYHFYGSASQRIMGDKAFKPEHALDAEWLQRTDASADRYKAFRDKYDPGAPLWNTETAQAAGGGDPFAATYVDCFRYLYQMGSLAKKGVQVVMHNTLAASEYSLIDQDTHLPKPNYWAALLWARLMGTEVYDAGTGAPGVYIFAHNRKGQAAGVTLLVINTNATPTTVNLPSAGERYTLTSDQLQGASVQLNGQELKLTAQDELPAISGQAVNAGNVELPATSITFISLAEGGQGQQ